MSSAEYLGRDRSRLVKLAIAAREMWNTCVILDTQVLGISRNHQQSPGVGNIWVSLLETISPVSPLDDVAREVRNGLGGKITFCHELVIHRVLVNSFRCVASPPNCFLLLHCRKGNVVDAGKISFHPISTAKVMQCGPDETRAEESSIVELLPFTTSIDAHINNNEFPPRNRVNETFDVSGLKNRVPANDSPALKRPEGVRVCPVQAFVSSSP
mmetsp:Transcript_21934/g.43551  ORF Transcript_21934/g.43551 Transcript_21934/m.43551 type:complete len:213 (-) Transcript_21934:1381-2019(-)